MQPLYSARDFYHDLRVSTEPLEEQQVCLAVFESYAINLFAFYATQYFTSGAHARHYELADGLKDLAGRLPSGMKIFVIGTLGQTLLEKFPDAVVAAGQNQWRKRITPRTQTTEEMLGEYIPLATDTNRLLGTRELPSTAPRWFRSTPENRMQPVNPLEGE